MPIPVKLPKEVLNLFPTWEYRCPCCGIYVESGMSFCPNCKTPFDEKRWCVPPRFLKSHDAMSEYAHKVLAPKLTPEQREILFKYFTEFFSDGFESGDFSAWTTTSTGNGGTTPTVSTDQAHHGSKSVKLQIGTSATSWSLVRKVLDSSYQTIYIREYCYITALPDTTSTMLDFLGCGTDGVGTAIVAGIYRDASANYKWAVMFNDGPTFYYGNVLGTPPTINTWYLLELYVYVHASSGACTFYVNESAEVEITSADTDITGNISRVDARLECPTGGSQATSKIVYMDCFVVADTYIGPETAEQTYTKTWTADTLFKKLGITKALNVDAAFQKQNIQFRFYVSEKLHHPKTDRCPLQKV